jgi:anthranilate phosphoribosyltransferase
MKATLNELFEHHCLSEPEAYNLMTTLVTSDVNDAHTAALLATFIMRDIGLPELKGFRKALLDLAVPFRTEGETIDLCGTGGDGKNTFNISTLASFVVAAAGGRVVKHGNYGVSSVSGSSDVMEYLGYTFTNKHDELQKQLDNCGICFLHAPLFHPALKKVAHVRKQLGVKTFFNMLGPLVNPANPTFHFTGTYNLQLARLYHYLFQEQGDKYIVVHALDGYDEISLTSPCKWYSSSEEIIFTATDWDLPQLKQELLLGGNSVKEAGDIFITILEGNGTDAQNAVVSANAAAALHCMAPEVAIVEQIALASETLLTGKAFKTFKKLIA